MRILNTLIKGALNIKAKRILRYMQQPMEPQEQLMVKLLKKAQYTEWGKRYDYASIKNIQTSLWLCFHGTVMRKNFWEKTKGI